MNQNHIVLAIHFVSLKLEHFQLCIFASMSASQIRRANSHLIAIHVSSTVSPQTCGSRTVWSGLSSLEVYCPNNSFTLLFKLGVLGISIFNHQALAKGVYTMLIKLLPDKSQFPTWYPSCSDIIVSSYPGMQGTLLVLPNDVFNLPW